MFGNVFYRQNLCEEIIKVVSKIEVSCLSDIKQDVLLEDIRFYPVIRKQK